MSSKYEISLLHLDKFKWNMELSEDVGLWREHQSSDESHVLAFLPPPSQSIISHCLQRRTLLQTKVLRWELWHRASPWAGGAERRRLQEPQRAERGTAALCPAFCFSRALFQKSWETYGIALSKSMLKLGPTHRIGKVLGQNEFFAGIAYVWHGIIVTKHAKPFGVLAACVR